MAWRGEARCGVRVCRDGYCKPCETVFLLLLADQDRAGHRVACGGTRATRISKCQVHVHSEIHTTEYSQLLFLLSSFPKPSFASSCGIRSPSQLMVVLGIRRFMMAEKCPFLPWHESVAFDLGY
jgi:hypothetical protein